MSTARPGPLSSGLFAGLAAGLRSATAAAAPAPAPAPVDLGGSSFFLGFAAPVWLLAGAVALAALFLALRRADRRRRRDLSRLVSPQLVADLTRTVSSRRRAVRRGFLFAGIAFAFLALARPAGIHLDRVEAARNRRHARGRRLASMLARDVSPDRLTRAKLAVDLRAPAGRPRRLDRLRRKRLPPDAADPGRGRVPSLGRGARAGRIRAAAAISRLDRRQTRPPGWSLPVSSSDA
jgi:hypothetical protein